MYFIKKTNRNISKKDPFVVHAVKQLNKYKRVKFLKTHNLLTGQTSATPEQIEVSKIITIFSTLIFYSITPMYYFQVIC